MLKIVTFTALNALLQTWVLSTCTLHVSSHNVLLLDIGTLSLLD